MVVPLLSLRLPLQHTADGLELFLLKRRSSRSYLVWFGYHGNLVEEIPGIGFFPRLFSLPSFVESFP